MLASAPGVPQGLSPEGIGAPPAASPPCAPPAAAPAAATSLARATEAAEPGKHPLVNDLIADFSTLSSELQASRDAELAELHAAQATRTVQRSLFS